MTQDDRSDIVTVHERSLAVSAKPRPSHVDARLYERPSRSVLLRFRQEDIWLRRGYISGVENLTVTQITAVELPHIYKLLKLLRPTLTFEFSSMATSVR